MRFVGGVVFLTFAFTVAMFAQTNGVTTIESKHSVPASIDRLDSLVRARGMTVFSRIDFAADAARVDMNLRPEQLLVFGNPRAGTPLLQTSQVCGIDLPLKVLAWEDERGKIWLSYNTPEYITARHKLPEELVKNIIGIKGLVEKAAE
jgi:uncharacterized protein (DUF302 family)